MLLARSNTTYRRDRLLVNALVLVVAVVWLAALAVHIALWVTQGRAF